MKVEESGWYFMVWPGSACYWMVVHYIGYYSTMFDGIAWYCLVLYVIQGPTGTRYPKYFQYPINCQNHWVFRVSGIRENQVFDMNPCALV